MLLKLSRLEHGNAHVYSLSNSLTAAATNMSKVLLGFSFLTLSKLEYFQLSSF